MITTLEPKGAISLKGFDGVEITILEPAHERKNRALSVAKTIMGVDSQDTKQAALDAVVLIKRVLKQVEESRKEIKRPVLDLNVAIDNAAKAFIQDLVQHEKRINEHLDAYESEIHRIAQEAEAKRQAEIRRIAQEQAERDAESRKKQEEASRAILEAKNKEQRIAAEKAMEEQAKAELDAKLAQEHAQAITSRPVVQKADGQIIRHDLEFEVTDIHALYKSHPEAVKLEPIRTKIKELIKDGRPVAGVKFWSVTKVGVRTS